MYKSDDCHKPPRLGSDHLTCRLCKLAVLVLVTSAPWPQLVHAAGANGRSREPFAASGSCTEEKKRQPAADCTSTMGHADSLAPLMNESRIGSSQVFLSIDFACLDARVFTAGVGYLAIAVVNILQPPDSLATLSAEASRPVSGERGANPQD